ncbi:MAG TPA: PTS sugar transporter subunit IIA [Egibacteraceae bacterium]|nr:PTS sugar transporter subunit IIA [Egibacteraceae bacterium]
MTLSIDDITSESLVTLDLDSADRWAAIDELARLLEVDGRVTDRSAFVQAVRAREETGPTGMEMGIAIPHGKSSGVARPSVAFGRSPDGVDFGSADGTPADLVFLIAAPEGESDLHITLLSRLARKLVHDEFRDALRTAATPADVIDILRKEVTL